MPMHDWSRVDHNLYHDFHQAWAMSIRNALNAGILPEGYSALVEQHASRLVPDVLALERRRRRKQPPTGGTVLATAPATRLVAHREMQTLANRANRVAIRHRMGEVVCIIEIVSPGNKPSRKALDEFVEKTREFFDHGVNLLIVDPFPPTPRDPHGIHRAIWDDEFTGVVELPADKPLTLAAYVVGDTSVGQGDTAYVEPIAVGDALPDMPAYLDPDAYVPVPLEATYQTTWATCPKDMRTLVETGTLPDEPDDEE